MGKPYMPFAHRRRIVCLARDCKVSINGNKIMCKLHWDMVPPYQQDRVMDEWSPDASSNDLWWMISEAISAVRRYEWAQRAGLKPEGDTW